MQIGLGAASVAMKQQLTDCVLLYVEERVAQV
jgi:hypothetical protein